MASSSNRSGWYADKQLVSDESTVTSLALYKSLISNPLTDTTTKKTCYTKLVALLDSLPAVRAFNSQSADISQNLYDLLLYRCAVHNELAALYSQAGDVHNASHYYDRAARLYEALIKFVSKSGNNDYGSVHAVFESLEQTLKQWIGVEEAIGRKTKAAKLSARVEKLQAQMIK
ncbi:hypothetical protein IWW45_001760 [Coemansia sp. RSA 485]|nr:hypothetical protein IWW45_001760 [Coemansia sp. RSA 485]KAJ2601226.1 hypothetical protein GGF39_001355 [Coemansia sp. RSA 1721]